jgi:Fe2+ transport system protein FeoA
MASVISQTMPLELLCEDEVGIVVDIHGNPGLVLRLQEMGLHTGARVRMIHPGSPCILEINHQRYSMRLEDAASVVVDVPR